MRSRRKEGKSLPSKEPLAAKSTARTGSSSDRGAGDSGISRRSAELEEAGHPVAKLAIREPTDLGGEMCGGVRDRACRDALASTFDSQCQEAKDRTNEILSGAPVPPGADELQPRHSRESCKPSVPGIFAVTAYVPTTRKRGPSRPNPAPVRDASAWRRRAASAAIPPLDRPDQVGPDNGVFCR